MLATRNFLPQMRFTPTQKMRTEPVSERLAMAASVKSGLASTASRVIVPWITPTGIAEKMQPRPREAVMTKMTTMSITALAARIE